MRYYLVLIVFLLIGFTACQKENNLSAIPNISFQALTPNTVRSGNSEDSIGISFAFKDGDADIGHDPKSGEFDIFLIDSRDSSILKYFFPPIPEEFKDPTKGLEGFTTVVVKAAFLIVTDSAKADTFHYEVYIKDRANNESNHFTTPDIILTP